MKFYPLLVLLLWASCSKEPVLEQPQEPITTTPTPDPPQVSSQQKTPCEDGMAGELSLFGL